MIVNNESVCPSCNNKLKHFGFAKRVVRTKYGNVKWTKIRILFCSRCKKTHRKIPDHLLPYKHYEAEIIKGVMNGTITPDNLDFEDYPCETTMKRWKKSCDK